ncbi:TadE/TadG family type IV pilus assembly protein [Parvularcula sp. LCG005]|uniref:TadE/TadG family type IV pilus assembly protein n=1 Tax=Parvularcula sp. LCG005 TaxID=3078805 RepID=UPI0029439DCA|nr:TadE/TadG family type IV pilus assembly protein [Parvularcula sp. LCG005]WOI54027.1 TadE/TadG family type IV pilus assembly protein [Parvularcula sp. LCG005]
MVSTKRSQRGNVAIMAALLILPTFALLGGAIDISRAIQQRIELQRAVDAAVLAASSLTNERDMTAVAEEYLATNLATSRINFSDIDLTITAVEDNSGRRVRVEAAYALSTMFLPLIDIDSLDISAESGGRQDWQRVEIALVLDVSGSMAGTRIANLITAGEDFIDTILTDEVRDLTSVSIIPFGTHVNVGDEFKFFVNPSTIDNHLDNDFHDGHRWQGCLNLRPSHFSDLSWTSYSMTPLPEYFHYGVGELFSPYRSCPRNNNRALYQSNNSTDLINKIKALTAESDLAGLTSIDEGTLIGLKSLSPDMRGRFGGSFAHVRPADFRAETLKVLIVMSDGNMNKYFQPKTCWEFTLFCSELLFTNEAAESNFLTLCQDAKTKGVIVFTIGFGIDAGSNADTVLRSCASTVANYYLIDNTEIEAAFSAIAANINRVRIFM